MSSEICHKKLTEALSNAQHGFTKKRSCLTNLLTEEKLTKPLDKDENTHFLFLDFSKVDDLVSPAQTANLQYTS